MCLLRGRAPKFERRVDEIGYVPASSHVKYSSLKGLKEKLRKYMDNFTAVPCKDDRVARENDCWHSSAAFDLQEERLQVLNNRQLGCDTKLKDKPRDEGGEGVNMNLGNVYYYIF